MRPKWQTLIFHAVHIAAAAALAALLTWLGGSQQQIVAAVPAHYQAIAGTALALVLALYRQPPGEPKT